MTTIVRPNEGITEPSTAVKLWRQAGDELKEQNFPEQIYEVIYHAVVKAIGDPSNKLDPALKSTYETTLTCIAEFGLGEFGEAIQQCMQKFEGQIDGSFEVELREKLNEGPLIEALSKI